ncbi:MAG: hypothetical protein M3O70_04945, partial [Actinomycetota bacterium]|nr:hypothetical protein [Actinomycetota bacterium]
MPLPPWLRHVKRTLFMGWLQYEYVAMAVDDDDIVPKHTTLSHPDDDHPEQDKWRLALALATCIGANVHLLHPWV